ncbi:NADP-dependent oxidoreductase domain-containing protein [Kockovaella imperatae]|uniref:NADP-dependent oxidoreductase domain-containing protein n=1 Tax=Kockovaella imperatae TaxID=4999 RepID=A0A1Y1UMM6_9TREE|nr:NADP-dependent oxidoreductase domain-containing protein [Kockovaella imperatae]ORX38726.1 NADP-dependent oxidoreductase domain-containing protein [Kockovaella imperatae]
MSFGSIADTVNIRGNVTTPRYVFGTGGINVVEPIHQALDAGYRAFDTAQQYGNEEVVGRALKEYKIDRKDVFVITKVNKPGETVEATLEGIRESVQKLDLAYVDLFLIHNPNYGPEGRKIQWKALEQAKKEGLARAIGVSNFVLHHLEGMKEYATELPAVNQTELTMFYQDKEVVEWCNQHGVQMQSFAPVARAQKKDDESLLQVAKEVERPWNRVMLRWNWQKGYLVTCKSEKADRIRDNTSIFDFELSSAQMEKLDALDCGFKVTPSTVKDVDERSRYYKDMP